MDDASPNIFSLSGGLRRLSPPSSAGLPPVHPQMRHSPPSAAANGSASVAGGHSRSLSQPSFFSLDALPPLSPTPPSAAAAGPGTAAVPMLWHPKKQHHRRSQSDVPTGFTLPAKPETVAAGGDADNDLVDEFMDFDSFDLLNSSGDLDSRGSGTTRSAAAADSSETDEAESKATLVVEQKGHSVNGNNKRCAPEGGRSGRHCRSLSMDSFMAGRMSFGDESPGGQLSRSNSLDKALPETGAEGLLAGLELGNGPAFNENEKKKIAANERLAEMVLTDPKRVKRILANRQSAARSKERKSRYIAELEHKVQTLQTEATTLSAQLTLLQRDSAGLATQNNELRIRLQAMEQQAHLRDALNEALTAEVQRLRLATGEAKEPHLSNGLQHHMASQMIQLQQHNMQQRRQQVAPQQKQQQSA